MKSYTIEEMVISYELLYPSEGQLEYFQEENKRVLFIFHKDKWYQASSMNEVKAYLRKQKIKKFKKNIK